MKDSYLGGHRVLTQTRKDFETTLARDAARARSRTVREQAEFDREQQQRKQAVLDKITKANAQMVRPWHR